jgi:hypothetical protein
VELEALTKQNGVRLFIVKLKKMFKKKEVKTDLPYLSFYKKKPETHIFFFGLELILKYFVNGKFEWNFYTFIRPSQEQLRKMQV